MSSYMDGRIAERALVGEGQGAWWFEAGDGYQLVFRRSEPIDYLSLELIDDNQSWSPVELERVYVRYVQHIIWKADEHD